MSEPRAVLNDTTQTYASIKETWASGKHAGAKFDSLNAHILNRVVIAGELIILGDDSTPSCTSQEAWLMNKAVQVWHSLVASGAGGDGAFLQNYDFLQAVLGNSAIGIGVASDAAERHLKEIGKTLEQIKTAHHEYRNAKAPDARDAFLKKRASLFKDLNTRLNGFSQHATGLRNQGSIKRMLQLSTKSFMHTGELAGYADKVGAVAKATALMSKGIYVGIGLNVVSTGLEIKEACSTGREEQCTKAMYVEGSGLLGATAGGYAGGKLGGLLGTGACLLAFGLPTGGAGSIACAVIAGAIGGTQSDR